MAYTLNPFSGHLDYYDPDTGGTTSSGANMTTESFTLSSADIGNKYVDLSHTPNTVLEILIFIVGGTKGVLDSDYFMVGNRIGWNGKAWDGLLETNDIMNATYWY